jgi:hypothetical protein
LRWDFQQKPYERNNGQINFDPNAIEPITGLHGTTVYAGMDGQPRTFMDEDYNDFGPRVGFAWDVFGSGKTIVRAGYGIFYPSIFFRNFMGNTALFSTTRTSYTAQGPGLPAFQFANGFPYAPIESPGAAAGPSALLGQGVSLRESDATTPMTQQWNFAIQQQIGDWLIDATYAANKGNHFSAAGYDLNEIDPDVRLEMQQSLFDSVPNPYAGLIPGGLGAANVTRATLLKTFPQYTSVNILNPRYGNYVSHALQVNVKRRFKSGFMMLLAYTAGKKMSDGEQVPVDFGLTGYTIEGALNIGFQDGLFNRAVNKSVDPADVSQRAVISLLYELPFGQGKSWNFSNGALRRIVSGWQINTIGVMQTGIPLSIRGASNNAADRPNSTGVSAKLGHPTAEQWFDTSAFVNPPPFALGNVGRVLPDVRAPGTVNFDLSLIKDTTITERTHLQFRAEAFNFLNHVNLGLPNTSFSAGADGKNQSATFGTITTARDARVMQFGLKLIF